MNENEHASQRHFTLQPEWVSNITTVTTKWYEQILCCWTKKTTKKNLNCTYWQKHTYVSSFSLIKHVVDKQNWYACSELFFIHTATVQDQDIVRREAMANIHLNLLRHQRFLCSFIAHTLSLSLFLQLAYPNIWYKKWVEFVCSLFKIALLKSFHFTLVVWVFVQQL